MKVLLGLNESQETFMLSYYMGWGSLHHYKINRMPQLSELYWYIGIETQLKMLMKWQIFFHVKYENSKTYSIYHCFIT